MFPHRFYKLLAKQVQRCNIKARIIFAHIIQIFNIDGRILNIAYHIHVGLLRLLLAKEASVVATALLSGGGRSDSGSNSGSDRNDTIGIGQCDSCDLPSNEPDSSSCSICMAEFDEGEDVRLLPCIHQFHCVCIDKWLATDVRCPMCKTPITVGDDYESQLY